MHSRAKRSLIDQVGTVLDRLRPLAQSDGGDIELVDADTDGVVTVRLHGACTGCPSSAVTLRLGIERNLRDQIPEVTRVVCEQRGDAGPCGGHSSVRRP